jgi:hypothetical protein
MHTYPHPMTHNIRLPSLAQILQAAGFVLLRMLTTLAVVLLMVPVALLPVGTAVPALVWVLLAIADVALVVVLVRFARTRRAVVGALLGVFVVAVLAVVASQAFAATPPILGANGKPIPGSIAVMEKVNLGGSEQWITIRGKDVNKPVLLYLGIGGPGAGGFPASALTLAPLEEHFVVVNWDQPGTGKSYDAAPIATLTVERFVSDAHELTQLLRARFHQDKIYVLGLSWARSSAPNWCSSTPSCSTPISEPGRWSIRPRTIVWATSSRSRLRPNAAIPRRSTRCSAMGRHRTSAKQWP